MDTLLRFAGAWFTATGVSGTTFVALAVVGASYPLTCGLSSVAWVGVFVWQLIDD